MMSLGRARGGRRLYLAAAPLLLGVAIFVFLALGFGLPWPTRTVQGMVLDAETGQPISGALASTSTRGTRTDRDGAFTLEGVGLGGSLTIDADGYRPARVTVGFDPSVGTFLQPRVVQGTVVDADSGAPVAAAAVRLGDDGQLTDQSGAYRLARVRAGRDLVVSADGYQQSTVSYDGQSDVSFALRPNVLDLTLVDALSGKAIPGARVDLDGQSVSASGAGQFHLTHVHHGAGLTVAAEGYGREELSYDGRAAVELRLYPILAGQVVDATTGKPLSAVTVGDGVSQSTTDADGRYSLKRSALTQKLTVTGAGYDRGEVDLSTGDPSRIALRPRSVRALYLTYYGAGSDDLSGHAYQLAQETDANAVVIDVKGDRGWLVYRSAVPLVQEIGAQQEVMIDDIHKLMAFFKERNIYTIARIVVFKDHPLAMARPELAVQDGVRGGAWLDGEGLRWVDPFREEVWDYNIALAREAASYGFDEVQFDYVRFPTDPSPGTTMDATAFSRENLMANRVEAITGFLCRAREALRPTGTLLAADVFGYVTWRSDDMGIGQRLEDLGRCVDVISPMVYPTLYWDGIPVEDGPTFSNDAPAHPYEIVHLSLKRAQERLDAVKSNAKLRPWLQYYNDYIMDVPYGAREVDLQKRATYDVGITGWMFWDPSNRYAKGGFELR